MIRSRQSRVHPRASTRYTLAKSVFSPRKPRGTISIESIRVHEGEAATAGGHECVSTLSCPPDNGGWVTPYQGIRKERLVSCNAIFFDPRGRAIYIYIYRLVLHTRNTRSVEDDGENSSLHFDPCEYTRCCVQSLEEKWSSWKTRRYVYFHLRRMFKKKDRKWTIIVSFLNQIYYLFTFKLE